MHRNRLNSVVLLKTALFSLKFFYLIHALFFWQNSTTNCVFYPLIWFKWANSLDLMFSKSAKKHSAAKTNFVAGKNLPYVTYSVILFGPICPPPHLIKDSEITIQK